VSETTLQPNQTWSNTVAMIGDDNSSKAVLEVSSIPAINLEKRLSYLITYPHGCIEQTTSSVFPQLVLNQLMDLDDYTKNKVDIGRSISTDRSIASSIATDQWFAHFISIKAILGYEFWK